MNEQSFLLIMRASHVIKGASSNLMCKELNETAKNLEQSAASGNGVESGASDELEKATQDVKDKYSELKKAVDNYYAFLDSVDV
jgi:HPt (histidine-containing phosphotransfer) domain-containing protein